MSVSIWQRVGGPKLKAEISQAFAYSRGALMLCSSFCEIVISCSSLTGDRVKLKGKLHFRGSFMDFPPNLLYKITRNRERLEEEMTTPCTSQAMSMAIQLEHQAIKIAMFKWC
ncbi:uncharacterized protein LOC127265396 [Andrographis paniculata]|uniref:uncharacterized protein LOC127265396 n=1 Tax=Andrographis paniculata TaxID=175694 RepID=UPI0021E73B97|nr:uncharacterized protein LOC127265396 [Andrographis paniculata]